MKLRLTQTAQDSLSKLPPVIRKRFYKQVNLLLQDAHHPSLRTKKYGGVKDVWQARVNREWRFYFRIVDDSYVIEDVIPHPK